MHGTYETIDGRPALRFERQLAHPVDAVWRAVTEPSQLAHWFPAEVTVDHRVGGRMTFDFPDEELPPGSGEVTEFDPPRVFAFDWDGFEDGVDHLRFELEPVMGGEACLLRFTHVITSSERASRDAAGWHVCLDRLGESLAGGDARAPTSEPTADWRELYEDYQRRGLPAGAEIPS
jgi:uncharacterized protein YndB with AHSA1/START domain